MSIAVHSQRARRSQQANSTMLNSLAEVIKCTSKYIPFRVIVTSNLQRLGAYVI